MTADPRLRQFWRQVEYADDMSCWLWTGTTVHGGYGIFWFSGTNRLVHRLAYTILVGPIPVGLELDHVKAWGCFNRRCVNPTHLEPVTSQTNTLRGDSPAAQHAKKTHCPRGHEYNEENTRMYRGRRYCRPCDSARTLARYRAQKAALQEHGETLPSPPQQAVLTLVQGGKAS